MKFPTLSQIYLNLEHSDMIFDWTSHTGVLYGCGEQKIGARVNLAAFYLAGIPLAVLLAFILHLNGMVCAICQHEFKISLTTWIEHAWNNENVVVPIGALAWHRLRQPHQVCVARTDRTLYKLGEWGKSLQFAHHHKDFVLESNAWPFFIWFQSIKAKDMVLGTSLLVAWRTFRRTGNWLVLLYMMLV